MNAKKRIEKMHKARIRHTPNEIMRRYDAYEIEEQGDLSERFHHDIRGWRFRVAKKLVNGPAYIFEQAVDYDIDRHEYRCRAWVRFGPPRPPNPHIMTPSQVRECFGLSPR